MTAMPVVERMTAEEFLARTFEDEHRWDELVGGEVIMDPPKLPHQLICAELLHTLMLWTHAETGRGLASMPLAIRTGPHDVYQPDIVWYREDRRPARADNPPYPVPDLAIEVRSPSTWRYDIGAKKSGYERVGLPELWLVDSAADVVLVFRRSEPDAPDFDVALEFARGDALTSPRLPGFALAIDALFG